MNRYSFIILLLSPLAVVAAASAQLQDFVTTKGDKLMEGDKELRFVSYNVPDLHYIEDNQEFTSLSPWRAANEFEIRDTLLAIRQAGGKVTRTYVISVRKGGMHQLSQVEFIFTDYRREVLSRRRRCC